MRTRTHIRVRGGLLLALLLLPASAVCGQSVSVIGGPLELRISAAVAAGSAPAPVTDSSTTLDWSGGGGSTSKIIVETLCPGQSFSLYVSAALTSGTATIMPEVTLTTGMLPADLVRGIPKKGGGRNGDATLTYRAEATVSQGNSADQGDDAHTITYTIMAQ